MSATKTISKVFGTVPERMRLYFYIWATSANYKSVSVYIGSTSNLSKNFSATFYKTPTGPESGIHTGWNVLDIYPGDWVATGGEDWANEMIRLRVRYGPNTGCTDSVSFDSLMIGLSGFSGAILNFDDLYTSFYSVAYAYCHPRRIRLNGYAITDNVGTATFATIANLQEIYAAGHVIANHTKDHTDLTTLNQAQQQTEFLSAKNALNGWGLTKYSSYVSYPSGKWDENTLLAMAAENMVTGRMAGNAVQPPVSGLDNIYELGCRSIGSTISLATAKGYVDALLTYKRVENFLFHNLVAAGPTGDDSTIAIFQGLIDYMISKHIPILTIDDFRQSVSRAVTIPATW